MNNFARLESPFPRL